jgi:hypothetical protein
MGALIEGLSEALNHQQGQDQYTALTDVGILIFGATEVFHGGTVSICSRCNG